MREENLLIGGRFQAAKDGRRFERSNPVTGEVVCRAAAATVDDVDQAVNAAQAAFPAWAALAPGERRMRLLKAADLLDARTAEFISIGVSETGGTPGWYGFNVMLAANMLREAAAMTTQISGEVIPSNVPNNLAMAVRQPCGVVLGIAPWNAPVILGVRAVAMPLACGNTVVLKASEQCPGLHALIGRVLHEAGLGDGVVNVISNDPKDAPAIVERLVAHPAVRRVNFTGSTRVGRVIAKLAAEHLKPVLLELGGNNPLIVLDDADLDAACAAAAFSAFMNQGQICMSASRVIVAASIADSFIEKLAIKTATLKAGAPGQEGFVLGSLVNAEAAVRCSKLIRSAIDSGARLVTGGQTDGAIMQPTVVDHVTPAMSIYKEESFGNLVTIVRVRSDAEAVNIANDTEYGLSAAVFSRDIARALGIAKQIQSGICHINGPTVHDEAQMPFGGVKASGHGRFGGKAAIDEFTDLRWITIQTGPRHYPL
jgi:acyl-CoA reductase-like NAD-dependent aldehyde dehydrogenase